MAVKNEIEDFNCYGLIKLHSHNKFLQTYIDNYVCAFRNYCKDEYKISITGLGNFINKDDVELYDFLNILNLYGFTIDFIDDNETIECFQVLCTNINTGLQSTLSCNIDNLLNLIELSNKTGISIIGIIIIKIISRIISQNKILYKAIVLDLDDTIWNGTIAEIGIQGIEANLRSDDGKPYISFMNFVKILAEELGVYVAICSKNSSEIVQTAIETFDKKIFPLKGQIDYVVANYNDKSTNIINIASQLSILPSSIVFIDDNQIIRDEVRNHLSGVFVPEWNDHNELITLLISCCIFDRFELSFKSRNRRRQFEILRGEKAKCSLPKLYVKISDDQNHVESSKLYAKSNQFKLISDQIDFTNSKSLFFEIYRSNGENLGVCSAITYSVLGEACSILNWAISCRYFEIGVEEFVILHLISLGFREIHFACQFRENNSKIQEFIDKYYGNVITDSCDSIPANCDYFINGFDNDAFKKILFKSLDNKIGYNVYWICDSDGILKNNTKLKKIENDYS